MQTDRLSKSRTLHGVSDLTLAAPLRRGLVPAPDTRSYETRLTLLLRTLNTLRFSSLEVDPTPAIPDAVDAIRAIQAFHITVLDAQPARLLLLSVTFDGGWEPYMRRIWDDLGPLLDVIFCNCEGYLLSRSHSFADYAGWVRSAQVSTEFFYTAGVATVNDLAWLRSSPRAASAAAPGAAQVLGQALPGLAALYRLTDLYMPGTPDGDCLLRAARLLFKAAALPCVAPPRPCTPTEQAALAWFQSFEERPRAMPAPRGWHPANTQGGIVESYPGVTHGCLLLIALDGPAAAAALIRHLGPARLSAQTQQGGRGPFANLAFTLPGLRLAGVPEGQLARLPAEFLEGMAARAAVLGDVLENHPQHWTLPARNWPPRAAGAPPAQVALTSVHAVVQFMAAASSDGRWLGLPTDASHPLHAAVQAVDGALRQAGGRILSVEPMQRNIDSAGQTRDHFGFADGLSNPRPPLQPASAPLPPTAWDRSTLGDFLLGHVNAHGDPPLAGPLWTDSSFLVVRKLRQDVALLHEMVKHTPSPDEALAQMVGRGQDGRSPMQPAGPWSNDFDYSSDPRGQTCPFASHVRRANPRLAPDTRGDLRRLPRLLRRGMSYGPRFDPAAPDAPGTERGLMFMAYNASIAEQFELVQGWLSGGNSGGEGMFSGQRDPLFAPRRAGDPASFFFSGTHGPVSVPLGPRPPVTLQWGLYLFVPSIEALEELRRLAEDRARRGAESPMPDDPAETRAREAKKGALAIARLQEVQDSLGVAAAREQWKLALEDLGARQSGLSQCIWTAVRELHGGVLRTPYGVLVGSRERVMEVFDNTMGRYTVDGYGPRMANSFGPIYLGMDAGAAYQHHAQTANNAIAQVTRAEAFDAAFDATQVVLAALLPAPSATAPAAVDVRDIIDPVLGRLSRHFFGLPDAGGAMREGGFRSDDMTPCCPGHFHAPSRYIFQPNPGPEAAAQGERHGQLLRDYVLQNVARIRARNHSPIGRALAGIASDHTYASTLIGVMMGFLPTVDGNLRGALYEWVNDRSLWDLQLAYEAARARGGSAARCAARVIAPVLGRTMQLRPAPEMVWRTAKAGHMLGAVEVAPGDRIVVGIVSSTQQSRLEGRSDLCPLFGGDRRRTPHPTHACPGYEMAMGVMLGLLAALLASVQLRPTLSATVLHVARP